MEISGEKDDRKWEGIRSVCEGGLQNRGYHHWVCEQSCSKTKQEQKQHILHENKSSTAMDQCNTHGSNGKVHQSFMQPKL